MTHYLVSKYNMSSDCKTQEIVTAFVEIIDIDKNYELKDYKRIISDIFITLKLQRKKHHILSSLKMKKVMKMMTNQSAEDDHPIRRN